MATTVTSLRLASAMARNTLRPIRPKPEIAILTAMECSQSARVVLFRAGAAPLRSAGQLARDTRAALAPTARRKLLALLRLHCLYVNATVAFRTTPGVRDALQTTERLLTLGDAITYR